MRVEIKGRVPTDPRTRILALEAATRAICESSGTDPADGIMMLLTAAVHMSNTYNKRKMPITEYDLARSLGYAMVAAGDMFTLKGMPANANKQASPSQDPQP